MNNVTLIGRIATDVSVRESNGVKRASFRIALDRGTNPQTGESRGADFVWVNCWNGTAGAVAQYRKKGDEVGVSGSIRTSRVEKDGSFTDYVEVSAQRVEFLRTKGEVVVAPGEPRAAETTTTEPAMEAAGIELPPSDDDIPF